LAKNLHIFKVENRTKSERWGSQNYTWAAANEPKVEIWFYTNTNDFTEIKVLNEKNQVVHTEKIATKKGLNMFQYDYTLSKVAAGNWTKKDKNIKWNEAENGKLYLPVGKYKITITQNNSTVSTSFDLEASKR